MIPARHLTNVKRLVDAVLTAPGDCDPALRRVVEARAAALAGRAGQEAGSLPAPLRAYVDKVALHAYLVTDDDIAALRAAGYSEDAIFEITLSAAVGAGAARLERGLAVLRESPGGA